MARAADIESDPFFELLTDALRAGPGSPQWHHAVQRLRQNGGAVAGVDEYRLLVEAREHLESGRDYRSVRAGPGFTRRLFSEIEEQGPSGSGAPTATVITIVSALAILGVVAVVAALMMRGGGGPRPDQPQTDLATLYFPNDVASASFRDAIPAGWRTIGNLSLLTDEGLRPAVMPMEVGDYMGGGVVTESPIPADKPLAIEAVVTVPATAGDYIAEVFVSDSADFDERRATSPREVVWLLEGASQKVMVGGRNEGRVEPVKGSAKPMTVRIVVDPLRALVETRPGEGASAGAATTLWSGPHGLDPNKPRYAGVRFIRGAGGSTDVASVRSVRVVTRDPGSRGADQP
jgi:hypothetical protein